MTQDERWCNKQTFFVLIFVKFFVHFAGQFQRLSARVFDVMIKPDIGPSYNHILKITQALLDDLTAQARPRRC